MQSKNIQINKSQESAQDKQNQLPIQKKHHALIKRRKFAPIKLFSNVDFKYVINIGNICFINEQALRHPQSTDQTLLKSLYHYNMISKVTLNNSFVNIQLKNNNDNFLPPEYSIERLRSFGDKQMANIATNLENIHKQFSIIKGACPIQEKAFTKERQQTLLKNFIASRQGKKYFLYFSEISPVKITMKNIVFSVPLLQALGCNIKNIGMDFLRYKHVFFEVFTAKNYGNFLEGCFERFSKLQDQLIKNSQLSQMQKRSLTEMVYYDEVIRRKQGMQRQSEQTSMAKVLWFSPHPSICYFEIQDINESQFSTILKKKRIKQLDQLRPDSQLYKLQKLRINENMLNEIKIKSIQILRQNNIESAQASLLNSLQPASPTQK